MVTHRGWLTDAQLVDAVAVGQVTPGPVFTTATFIGYVLGGVRGAIVATVGIFLPAFFLVAASGPLISRIRKSKIASGFLDGVNVASLALMSVVSWQLTRTSLTDTATIVLAGGVFSSATSLSFELGLACSDRGSNGSHHLLASLALNQLSVETSARARVDAVAGGLCGPGEFWCTLGALWSANEMIRCKSEHRKLLKTNE